MGHVSIPRGLDPRRSLKAVEKALAERSLSAFIRQAWHVVEPGAEYFDNWHISFLADHLEAIARGEVVDGEIYRNLLINVPPGMMKPVHVDEPIVTRLGVKRLGDIVIGDEVLTGRGRFRPVLAIHDQGELPLVKVETFAGRSVRTAPDHPFLTPRGWVSAGDLNEHDYVGVPRIEESFGDGSVSAEEARLLGYLVGDGCLSTRSLSFVNADDDMIEDFISCAKSLGFFAYVKTHPNPNVKARKVVLKSREARCGGGEPPVLTWLRSHGLLMSNSYTKRIPPSVMRSGPEAVRNFIGAYWSCDGMIFTRHEGGRATLMASATTVGERLASDIRLALALIGIDSRVRLKSRALKTKRQGDDYRSFDIVTTRSNEVAKFADLPGLCERKKDKAREADRKEFDRPIVEDAVVNVLSDGRGYCRCLTVEEDASFTVDGLIVHNSLLVSVFWPAWIWGPFNMPHARFLCASHSQNLAIRDNLRMRRLIVSEWYQERWGDRVTLTSDQAAKTKFENTATGFREAVATGSITGARGDFVIIDDPHSVESAASEAMRASTKDWFLEAVPTRLNKPKSSSIVVIMQRLHEEDVSGIILEHNKGEGLPGWDHIMLPMRYDPDRAHPTMLGYEDPRDEAGDLLFPERFPKPVVDRLERTMGPFATAGQNQQSPVPRGGGLIKDDWWTLWPPAGTPPDRADQFPPLDYIVAVLDTAYTEKEENDRSALVIWGVFSADVKAVANKQYTRDGRVQSVERVYAEGAPNVMLLNAWAGRLDFPDLCRKVVGLCKAMKVDRLLIEDKAAGISVAQELRKTFQIEDFGIQLIPAKGDKWARLYSVQHLFAEGMIWAPDKTWAEEVIREVGTFPKGRHDDLVDCVAHGLRWLRDTGMLTRAPERLYEIEDSKVWRGGAPPPLYPGSA